MRHPGEDHGTIDKLLTKTLRSFFIFGHFFQMYVPNGVGAFGSSYKEIDDLDEGWNFFLTKTRWRYLDRPAQRCDEEVMYVIFELSLYSH